MTRDNNQLKADKHMSTATRVAMHALNDLFSTIQHNLPFVRTYVYVYVPCTVFRHAIPDVQRQLCLQLSRQAGSRG